MGGGGETSVATLVRGRESVAVKAPVRIGGPGTYLWSVTFQCGCRTRRPPRWNGRAQRDSKSRTVFPLETGVCDFGSCCVEKHPKNDTLRPKTGSDRRTLSTKLRRAPVRTPNHRTTATPPRAPRQQQKARKPPTASGPPATTATSSRSTSRTPAESGAGGTA